LFQSAVFEQNLPRPAGPLRMPSLALAFRAKPILKPRGYRRGGRGWHLLSASGQCAFKQTQRYRQAASAAAEQGAVTVAMDSFAALAMTAVTDRRTLLQGILYRAKEGPLPARFHRRFGGSLTGTANRS
jgi:hypothetical protein